MLRYKVGLGPSQFPLKVSSNGRYFTTQQDVPYFVNGNATWSLAHNLTLAEAKTCLDGLRAKSFNAVIFSVTDTYWTYGFGSSLDNLPDRNGNAPFTTGLTPYEPYWAHIDAVLDECLAREFTVFLTATYLGMSDSTGIRTIMAAQTDAACEDFGEFLGARYGGYPNVIWTHGGDCDPTPWASKVNAVKTGIDNVAPNKMHSNHWEPAQYSFADQPTYWPDSWYTHWNAYAYDAPVIQEAVYAHYAHGAKPTVAYETHYEEDWDNKTAAEVRPYPYRSALSGALGGFFFGNRPLWYCGTDEGGWEAALSSAGHTYMSYVPRLFGNARPWWKLAPSRDDALLKSGHGDPDTNTGAQAALSPDGDLAMVFYPSNLTISVDLAQLDASSRVTASWFNPATGAFSQIGGYATTGTQSFQPPTNADYVLVLESD